MAELRWPTTHANNLTAKAEITVSKPLREHAVAAIRRPAGRLADAFPSASGHTVAKLIPSLRRTSEARGVAGNRAMIQASFTGVVAIPRGIRISWTLCVPRWSSNGDDARAFCYYSADKQE